MQPLQPQKLIGFAVTALLLAGQMAFGQAEKADKFFAEGNYKKAIPVYQKVLKETPERATMVKLADCHRLSNQPRDAAYWYDQALNKTGAPLAPETYLHYGKVLQQQGNLDLAQKQYQQYADMNPSDPQGKALVASIDLLRSWQQETVTLDLEPVVSLNTSYHELSPVAYKGKLYFTSTRPNLKIEKTLPASSGNYYYDIYQAMQDSTPLQFSIIEPLPFPVNGSNHDGPATLISEDQIILTRTSKSDDTRFQLFSSSMTNGRWSKPKPLPFNGNDHTTAHPSLSADGNTLFFTSDMPGGMGGTDIYKSMRTEKGWGTPINLGPIVNTSGNEAFPVVMENGVLTFSSSGHPGYGGLDIFATTPTDGEYLEVYNLKAPINSGSDDFGLSMLTMIDGYFTSNRPGGAGGDDLYHFTGDLGLEGMEATYCNRIDPEDVCVKLDANTAPIMTNLKWDMGDGTWLRSMRQLKYCYKEAGKYLVKVYMEDSMVFQKEVLIDQDHEVQIKGPGMVLTNQSVAYDGSLSDLSGYAINKYVWEINGEVMGEGDLFEHTFSEVGSYALQLTVIGENEYGQTRGACSKFPVSVVLTMPEKAPIDKIEPNAPVKAVPISDEPVQATPPLADKEPLVQHVPEPVEEETPPVTKPEPPAPVEEVVKEPEPPVEPPVETVEELVKPEKPVIEEPVKPEKEPEPAPVVRADGTTSNFPAGEFYSIQVGLAPADKPVPSQITKLPQAGKLYWIQQGNTKKYFVGTYPTVKSSGGDLSAIKGKGISDAWVVKIKDGQRAF